MADGFRFAGTLAIVGGGRMGEAILSGLIASGAVAAERITVVAPRESRRIELSSAYGVTCTGSWEEALPADVAILAVKPQIIEPVVREMEATLSGSLVVSIAVGVSSARLEAMFSSAAHVVRVMPNTPAMVGEGMSVVSGGFAATPEQVELVRSLFAALGDAIVLDERHQDAAAAISGSGPAYFAIVIDALARAGVRQGLPREVAQHLAVQTMRGTAELIDRTGKHPEALVDSVTSPGGTTIAAVEALEARGIRTALAEAVAAAVNRAKELG